MSTKLSLKFYIDAASVAQRRKRTWTFSRISSEAMASEVRALANAMISSKDVYTYPPLELFSADFITTTAIRVG